MDEVTETVGQILAELAAVAHPVGKYQDAFSTKEIMFKGADILPAVRKEIFSLAMGLIIEELPHIFFTVGQRQNAPPLTAVTPELTLIHGSVNKG